MTISIARVGDSLDVASGYGRPTVEPFGLHGLVHVQLHGPDGELKYDEMFENLVTQIGDQVYGERGAGLGGAPAAAVGMQLGTGVTAVAKTGAGAAVVTFVTGSYKALTAAAATALNAETPPGRRITYSALWAAGDATANGISEVVLVNASTTTAQLAATTLARALLSPVVNKGASDTLTVTWAHDLKGA